MKKFEDDGRTIASMDLLDEANPSFGGSGKGDAPENLLQGKDARRAIVSATLASLLVALVFSAGIVAFVWFCTNIWFR